MHNDFYSTQRPSPQAQRSQNEKAFRNPQKAISLVVSLKTIIVHQCLWWVFGLVEIRVSYRKLFSRGGMEPVNHCNSKPRS